MSYASDKQDNLGARIWAAKKHAENASEPEVRESVLCNGRFYNVPADVAHDLAAARAEIERLKAENAKLEVERDEARAEVMGMIADRDEWNQQDDDHAMAKVLPERLAHNAAAARAENAKLREDAGRLDAIEACIRDGSYPSILNDIIATCQHSYATIGPGPALRTAIDAALGGGRNDG